MEKTIKKVVFNKLKSIPDNKALLWPDFQVAFDETTGKSINNFSEEVLSVCNELEDNQFARLEKLPNGMPRIVKCIDFDIWESSMNSSKESQINIDNFNAQNVQVGNENAMNINVTPEEFINALDKLLQNPKKSQSVLEKLSGYLKQGLGVGELAKKLVTLLS